MIILVEEEEEEEEQFYIAMGFHTTSSRLYCCLAWCFLLARAVFAYARAHNLELDFLHPPFFHFLLLIQKSCPQCACSANKGSTDLPSVSDRNSFSNSSGDNKNRFLKFGWFFFCNLSQFTYKSTTLEKGHTVRYRIKSKRFWKLFGVEKGEKKKEDFEANRSLNNSKDTESNWCRTRQQANSRGTTILVGRNRNFLV